jgi:hypothetical protein
MRTPVVSASYQNYQNDAVSSQLTFVTGDSESIDMYKGVLYTPLSNSVPTKPMPTTYKNWKHKYDITYMTLHPVPYSFFILKLDCGFCLFLPLKNRVYSTT